MSNRPQVIDVEEEQKQAVVHFDLNENSQGGADLTQINDPSEVNEETFVSIKSKTSKLTLIDLLNKNKKRNTNEPSDYNDYTYSRNGPQKTLSRDTINSSNASLGP